MELDVRWALDDDVVHASVQGVVDLAGFAELIEHASTRAAEVGVHLFLYEFRGAGVRESAFELFDEPERVERAGASKDDRLAILCAPEDRGFLTLERRALERGFQLRAFTSHAEAVAWLHSRAG